MVDSHRSFEEQFLEQIINALGLSYEQISANYFGEESASVRRARERYENHFRQMELQRRYWDSVINAEIAHIVFSIWIAGEGLEHIVGYNPQRLLTYQPEGR